ncbi:conserved hypothetical protein [Bosea sp. 62]|uniref:DUF4432 family protein n=1 Tax=unclassified Bosea (in: a-proteobacteria) TaxID=2653178 RepID=UPI0012555959|nr:MULTISPECIES: DUF4432 family protein [unclassified Bosea (in: a-proteobacteria)]CAD5251981.1 conserved hypothetical protein [Bosea sp. 21B]CAD5261181.1 conserved hypothetical protein [Bosea sp. 7B]CAD5273519.1 conserved hypothetical protein [Bosea sp. 46]VVT43411.1 conserved hypothetical protein [Bosea sp. EC-HK365B]VXB27591.1 conserved hypothetical protein [Bosea sp. 29B]
MRKPATFPRHLAADPRQFASVRRIVLAEGPEAGIETLAFSTGGGLDFWVTVGRLMDIATLSWRGVQLGWQSPAGLRRPDTGPAGRERRFSTAFGGFLNTCGFDHIRQPADGRPLHGSAPFTPARLIAYGEDWEASAPMLFCEGEALCWAHGGFGYRLRRRIEAPIGGSSLSLRDQVTVIGAEPAPIMALYHFNLGYPMIAGGSTIELDGECLAGPLSAPEDAVTPASLHPATSAQANCSVSGQAATIAFHWNTVELPWLQLWRDLRPGAGVMSIEPCSIGRLDDGRNAPSPVLKPGGSCVFEIDIDVADCRRSSGPLGAA